MRGVAVGTLIIIGLSILGPSDVALSYVVYPCALNRADARIDTFICPCSDGDDGNLETPILVVTGKVIFRVARETPTLANLVLELQGRQGKRWVTAARQVLDAKDSSFVQTCTGTMAAGPVAGRIVLVDADGNTLTFDQVRSLPEGTTVLRYIATFAGALPTIVPGEPARAILRATAIGARRPRTCTVDADGDGVEDFDVKTLTFRKSVRVPSSALLITP